MEFPTSQFVLKVKKSLNSELGTQEKRDEFWDPIDQEYFFDRHYYAFRAIFDFYRTGKLRRPLGQICSNTKIFFRNLYQTKKNIKNIVIVVF